MRRWLSWRRLAVATAGILVLAIVGGAVLDRLFPIPLDRVAERSTVVLDAKGQPLRAFETTGGYWRFDTEAADVDPRLIAMLIGYEDQRFYDHPGVDPLALTRAVGQMILAGHVVSGASTLTMQTARLIEPRPRTLLSKVIEVGRALQLEWHFSKDEILSLYLTLAPYGGNLEGVRAASLFYFGKEPDHLTVAEAALLVTLPQSPERRRPDRHPERAKRDRNRVLARLAQVGVLRTKIARDAAEEPVPTKRRPAPFKAPHLAERLFAANPGQSVITSTIDGELQAKLENLAARSILKYESKANLAILVVANTGRRVVASIGSADYFDSQRDGQVDMTEAVRSPGSTLKPFIYGMGFEDLICNPDTLVTDRPTQFGGYAPRNFDHLYRGEVLVREALRMSLNIPAVAVLDRVGPQRFMSRLAQAGVRLRLPKGAAPSLPIALGGVGVTLHDLVTLYSGLADGGRALPLRETTEAPTGAAATLLDPAAAWQVTSILRGMPPPPALLSADITLNGRRIAYKTGTSYGFRDAWAVGYDKDYTVGVWVGRPDGTFSAGRMGRADAAPILYKTFNLLPPPSLKALTQDPPPPGTLIATNSELPTGLRRLGPKRVPSMVEPVAQRAPRLAFPVANSTVEVTRLPDGSLPTVAFQALGGKMPLIWMVNGLPVAKSPFKRHTEWHPDGLGLAHVTVIDAAGRTVSADFWLTTPKS